MKEKLQASFYEDEDVLLVGKKLLGKILCSTIGGSLVRAIITETESYKAPEDKASHAFGMRKTKRNLAMYMKGGTTYVYVCYGMHALCNIVTGKEGTPHAVLLRGIYPLSGLETIQNRQKAKKPCKLPIVGPGKVAKALGITPEYNMCSLLGDTLWIEESKVPYQEEMIETLKRVGIDYAEEYAHMPWRFRLHHSFLATIIKNLEATGDKA